jgi:hypothetical protein
MINFKQFVLFAIEDKARDIYDRISRVINYRNIVACLLKLNDDELTDALETFLAKDRDPAGFLILVEEEVKAGIDITRTIELFVSLIYIHQYNIDTIEKFINTVGPNHKGIVSRKILKKLVENKQEKYLVEFIKHFPEYRSLLPIL